MSRARARLFSLVTVSLLALRAKAEEFKFVGHAFEAVRGGDARLNLAREAFLDFDHFRAARANQMMVMAVVAFADQFKPRRAVAEVKPLHHPHLFQQVHGAVNRRQIALAPGHGGKNFPVCERMGMSPENLQNCRARAGDLSRLLAQTARQRRHFLPLVGVGMGARFHFSKIRLAIPGIKPATTVRAGRPSFLKWRFSCCVQAFKWKKRIKAAIAPKPAAKFVSTSFL
jgi:hypothetical protein